jgi:pimeloyl-ACP methyl ester carboxylesterase
VAGRLPKIVMPGLPHRARHAGDDYGASTEPSWREVNWRDHLHSIEIEGRKVNYVDYGEGSPELHPVVLIHGLGGCWQNWLENIRAIAATGRRVLALDLPGFGFSEMPDDEISISGYGRVVNELCDRLDTGEVVLVGHSMGGFTACETAIQFPERVEQVVLISAAGITTSDLAHQPILVGARLVAILGERAVAQSERVVVRKRLRRFLYASFIRYPDLLETDFLYEITRGSGRPAFLPALRAIFEYDYRHRLPEIRCPALVVWGEDDMLVPKRDADDYERLIPRARKVVLEDTGHSAMIERPQTFNDLLVEFLAEDDLPAHEEELGGGANVRGAAGGNGASNGSRPAAAAAAGGG